MNLLDPLIVQNCKTILTADPELSGRTILVPIWHIYPRIFQEKPLI